MADEADDQILNYDVDQEFVPFANEGNKELNKIVQEKKRLINQLTVEIEGQNQRLKVLNDHFNSVKSELIHMQQLVDHKNKQIETQDHMKQIAERYSGRLMQELKKFEAQAADQQDRLNNIQNMIFKANQQMDKFKLMMNWNQEELQQWALAARQKEQDYLALEKYRRADDVKIKELTLQVEKLTIELNRKSKQLQEQVTITRAAQIELDKTAQEFKKLHGERNQLYLQWQETVENSRKRDQMIRQAGQEYAQKKLELERKTNEFDDKKNILSHQDANNKELEIQIAGTERFLARLRTQYGEQEDSLSDLKDRVQILKNQLSAFASDLTNKRINVASLNKQLDYKKQRLEAAQKKYVQTSEKLKRQGIAKDNLESANVIAEGNFKQSQIAFGEVEKEIRQKKEALFKTSQQLFKLREEQANLIGDISGTISATKNLDAKINKLRQDDQRQHELLYNSEYQIQQLERKVARASGERSQEETTQLKEEIKKLQQEFNDLEKETAMLGQSTKQLADEIRVVERNIQTKKEQKGKIETQIHELELENQMASIEFKKIVRNKEEVLVQHDIMKLEIKKLRDQVNIQADKVFGLENRKYQLEMSMEERQKEIKVHKDILVSELKAAQNQRHKVSVELQERKNKMKNLRIKYEGLIQKNKGGSDGDGEVQQHSQAYFVIKAAQDREELQRYGDELDGKIRKCEKELRALKNTLDHLKGRNKNYRDKFIQGAQGADKQRKDILQEQCRAVSEDLFAKRKQLQKYQKHHNQDMERLNEILSRQQEIQRQFEESNNAYGKLDKDLGDQQAKLERASKSRSAKLNNLKSVNQDYNEGDRDNEINAVIQDEVQDIKNKYLLNAIAIISNDVPQFASKIDEELENTGMRIPSRPSSAISLASSIHQEN